MNLQNLLLKIACLGLLVLSFCLVLPSANAVTCQDIAGKQVCLVSLKRSAKYYWEYRVILSIDGRKQSIRTYNCRDRYYLADSIQFTYRKNDSLAKSVCRLYQK